VQIVAGSLPVPRQNAEGAELVSHLRIHSRDCQANSRIAKSDAPMELAGTPPLWVDLQLPGGID
jgi:hypothetical protein